MVAIDARRSVTIADKLIRGPLVRSRKEAAGKNADFVSFWDWRGRSGRDSRLEDARVEVRSE
jgi:hypothetical protein